MAITYHLQMDEGGETEGLTPDTYEKELRYFAHCDDNETHADVRHDAWNTLPTTYLNLIRTSVSVPRRVTFDTIFEVILEFRHPGGRIPQAPLKVDDTRVSIRSSGGRSENMKFSLEAQMIHPGTTKPIELDEVTERVIGYEGAYDVRGYDIDLTTTEITVETVKPGNLVSARYLINCGMARGKVNNFPYRGFPRGTLRLMAFDAVEQVDPGTSVQTPVVEAPDWNLTFVFEFKPSYNGVINMIDSEGNKQKVPYRAEGHWLLDPHFVLKEIPANGTPGDLDLKYKYPSIDHAMLHRLYEYEDFELLLQI